jgi:hypothetical protein
MHDILVLYCSCALTEQIASAYGAPASQLAITALRRVSP